MSKNGSFFISVVQEDQVIPSTWDPYSYRSNSLSNKLEDFVVASKVKNVGLSDMRPPFAPIEYSHIPKGQYLSFILEFPTEEESDSKWPLVGEEQLLFGTMRAYLGNAVITPRAEWLGLEGPLYFRVKSEFVHVKPSDGLHYFWWAYLRSSTFLNNLPLGGGGTRPRLHVDDLLQIPLEAPEPDTRSDIHRRLKRCAQLEWKEYTERMKVLEDLDQLCRPE